MVLSLTDAQKNGLFHADKNSIVYAEMDFGPFATLHVLDYLVGVGQTVTARYGSENPAIQFSQTLTCVASGPSSTQFAQGASNTELATNIATAINAHSILGSVVYAQAYGQFVQVFPEQGSTDTYVEFTSSSEVPWSTTSVLRLPRTVYACSGNTSVLTTSTAYAGLGDVPVWNVIESIGAVASQLDPVTRAVSIGSLELTLHGDQIRQVFKRAALKGRAVRLFFGNSFSGTYASSWTPIGSFIVQDWIPEQGGIRVQLAEPFDQLIDTKIVDRMMGVHPLAAMRRVLSQSGLTSSQYLITSETDASMASIAHWAVSRTDVVPVLGGFVNGLNPIFSSNPIGEKSDDGYNEKGIGSKGLIDELCMMVNGALKQNASGQYTIARYNPEATVVRHITAAEIADFEVETMHAHHYNRVRVFSNVDDEEFLLYGESDISSVLRTSVSNNSHNFDLDIVTSWLGCPGYLMTTLPNTQTINMNVFGAVPYGFCGTRPEVRYVAGSATYPTQRATDPTSGTRFGYLLLTDGINSEIVRTRDGGVYIDWTMDLHPTNQSPAARDCIPRVNPQSPYGGQSDDAVLNSHHFDPDLTTNKRVLIGYQFTGIDRGQLGTTAQTWTITHPGAINNPDATWVVEHPFVQVYDITIAVQMVQDRIDRCSNGIPICRGRFRFEHLDLELGDFITFDHPVYLNYTKDGASSLVVWEVIGKEIDVTGDSPGVNVRLAWVRNEATVPKNRVPHVYPSRFPRWSDVLVDSNPPILGLPGDFTWTADSSNPVINLTDGNGDTIISAFTGGSPSTNLLTIGSADYATQIQIPDHTAPAFRIYEGSNTYMRIETTNSFETLILGNSLSATTIYIKDDYDGAFRILEGLNSYLKIDTLNSAQLMSFGYDGPVTHYKFRGAGYVGIGHSGTDLPGARLHVRNASSAATVRSDSSLVVESSGTNFINVLSGNSAVQGIAFGSPSSNDRASFAFTGSSGRMGLLSAGSERIGIVGNNVLIRDLAGVAGDSVLHVFGTSGQAGTVDAPTGTVVTIENGASAHLSFLTPANGTSTIHFGDVDDNDVSLISYSHTLNRLDIYSNTVNVAQFLGTRVLLGTTGVDFVWSGTGWTLNGTQGTAGQVLVSNATTTPTWSSAPSLGSVTIAGDVTGTLAATTVVDLTIASEERGDLLYRGASAWVRRAVGTVNQHLGSDGTDPTWEDNSSIAIAGQITGTLGASVLGIGTGIGSMLRRNSGDTSWETVAVGSAGQVLTVVSGLPQWAAAAGGSTLDAAYDFGGAGAGRTINVDVSLPVFLSASHTSTSPLLHLRQADTGDTAIQYDIGATTTSWIHGIDNSVGDVFKFSYASGTAAVLGTGDVLTLTSGQVIGPTGSVTLPGVAVGSAGTYGLYQTGSVLALSAAGALALDVSATETNSQGRVRTISGGTAGAPAFWAGSDTGLGLYRYGTNIGALAAGSIDILRWSSEGIRINQQAQVTGSPIGAFFVGGAHTTLTASVEASDVNFNLGRTVQFATGALTTQRAFQIQRPTYAFVGASTITDAATLAIDNAPAAGTNATITNPWAILVQAGASGFGAGTEARPGVAFALNPNLGLYRSASDSIALSSAGVYRQSWDTTTINFRPGGSGGATSSLIATQSRWPAGGETLPGIAFETDADTGIYPHIANGLAFSCNAKFYVSISESEFTIRTNATPVARLTIGSAGQWTLGASGTGTSGQVLTSGGASAIPTWTTPSAGVSYPLLAPDGTDGAPSYSFADDTNTGIRGSSTVDGQMHFVSNGTTRMLLDAAFMDFTVPFRGANGADSAPTFSFSGRTTTGMYSSAADTINFSAGSASRLSIDTNSVDFAVAALHASGTESAPGISFTAETDCGLYVAGTNLIGLSIGDSGGAESQGYRQSWGPSEINFRPDGNTILATFTATQAKFANGSDTSPSIAFDADTGDNTGFYRVSEATIGFSCDGVARAILNTTSLDLAVSLRPVAGSEGTPSHSFSSATNQGMYSASSTLLGVSVSGGYMQSWDSSADVISFRPLGSGSPIALIDATQFQAPVVDISEPVAPGLSFLGDIDTGFYNFTSNGVAVACQGYYRQSWDTSSINFRPGGNGGNLVLALSNTQASFLNGSAGVPVLRGADTDSGVFFGSGTVGMACDANQSFTLTSAYMRILSTSVAGALSIDYLEETIATTSGTVVTGAAKALPEGALLIGAVWYVISNITGVANYDVGITASPTLWISNYTGINMTNNFHVMSAYPLAFGTGGDEIRITGNTTFTGGSIRVRVYYMRCAALTG